MQFLIEIKITAQDASEADPLKIWSEQKTIFPGFLAIFTLSTNNNIFRYETPNAETEDKP